jgi:hypothetical protein
MNSAPKGFGTQSGKLPVEARKLNTLVGEIHIYLHRISNLKLGDLDSVIELLGIAYLPQKVWIVIPDSGIFKGQKRRAVKFDTLTEMIRQASEFGNQKAQDFHRELVLDGMKLAGIKDAVVVNGQLIPRNENDELMYQFAVDISDGDFQ